MRSWKKFVAASVLVMVGLAVAGDWLLAQPGQFGPEQFRPEQSGSGELFGNNFSPNAGQPAPKPFRGQAQPATGGLITHFASQAAGPHLLVMIDPSTKTVGVYSIDPQSGELALKSVRNVTWDLKMIKKDSGKPTPEEVREALPRN